MKIYSSIKSNVILDFLFYERFFLRSKLVSVVNGHNVG